MCFTCAMQGLLQIQPLTIEIRKAATNQISGYPSKSNILLFWSDGRFSPNETPRFPARLLSLFLVVKNRGKRIKTNQQTLEISGIFRFVFIIVYRHSLAMQKKRQPRFRNCPDINNGYFLGISLKFLWNFS